MSYNEYLDLFFKAQERDCPFKAYTFDIANSRNQTQYAEEHDKYLALIDEFYEDLKIEEAFTNPILLEDDKNIRCTIGSVAEKIKNGNLKNPIVLGDNITYFVHNKSIEDKRVQELFSSRLNALGINYPFHFTSGVYETNDYAEGDKKLFKGYMPQILESLSKETGILISKEGIISENAEDLEM